MEDDLLPPPPPKKNVVSEDDELLPPPPKKNQPSKWDAFKSSIPSYLQPLVEGVEAVGRSVYSGIADQTPIAVEQAGEVLQSAVQPTNTREYIKQRAAVDFQKYVRERDPNFQGAKGFFTPFNEDDYIDKYGNQFMIDTGRGTKVAKMEENLPNVVARRQDLEKLVQEQKTEAKEKLGSTVQSIEDVKDLGGALSYAGNAVGQALYQIPLSFFTRGGSSLIMESATIYDEQLDELAEKNGISREEVIKRNLDRPALNQSYALLASALDAASSGSIIGALRKEAGKSTAKVAAKNIIAESATEAAQGNIERFAGQTAAGSEFDPLSRENLLATANETISGALGAGVFSFSGGPKKELEVADAMINQTSTGNPQIDSVIDTDAQITPEQQSLLKQKASAETIRENAGQIQETGITAQGSQSEGSQNIQLSTPTETSNTQNQINEENSQIQNDEGGSQGNTVDGETGIQSLPSETEEVRSREAQEKVAVDAVRKLQQAYDSLSITEDGSTLYKQLQEAKDELRKLAPEKYKRAKTDIQKQIEDAVGITKSANISISPSQAIKAQFEAVSRGMKEGVEIGKDKVNELVDKVREAVKDYPLSKSQVNLLLSKVRNTNLNVYGTSPRSVSALNQFIDKVTRDAQYANKLENIYDLQKKLKKSSKAGTPQQKGMIKLLSALEPEDADLDLFTEALTAAQNGFKPIPGKYKAFSFNDALKFLDATTFDAYEKEFGSVPEDMDVPSRLEAIKQKRADDLEAERYARISEKTGIDINELRDFIDSVTDDEIAQLNADAMQDEKRAAKLKKLRKALMSIAQEGKSNLDNVTDITPENQRRLDAIKQIDLNDLNDKDLKEYIRIVDNITVNNDFGNSERLVAKGTAIQAFKTLFAKLKGGKVLNLNRVESGLTASLPQAIEAVFGSPQNASLFNLYAKFNTVSNAKALAETEAQAFVKMMNDLEKANNKSFKKENGFSDESQFRQGIYTELLRHDILVDGDKFLQKNKAAITSSIQAYRDAEKEEDAKLIEKLYEPFKDAKTIDEVKQIMGKIDPAGKKVAEAIIDWFTKYKPKIDDYNEAIFNSSSQNIANYAGERNWIKQLPSLSSSDENVDDLKSVKFAPTKVNKITSAKTFTGAIPKGRSLDFNLHKKAADQVEETTFRINADPARLHIREMASRFDDMIKLFGGDTNRKKAIKIYNRIFDKNAGMVKGFEDVLLNRQYKSELEKTVSGYMSAIQAVGYVSALSGITQAPKQFSVLLSTATNLGRNVGMLATSIADAIKPGFNDFFEGQTVSMRGVSQSELNLGDVWRASSSLATENKIKKLFSTDLPQKTTKILDRWWGGLRPLTVSDASAAKISFLAYYKDRLSDLGEEFQGFAKEKALRNTEQRQEALAYAKQMVDKTQVVSNPAELATGAKTKTITAQIVKAWLLPFGSFRLNKVQRLYSNYRALKLGTTQQKKAAAKDLGAAVAESVAFETISWGLRILVYNNLRALYRELFDLEADDEEDDKLETKKKVTEASINILIDNLPLLLAEPIKNLLVDGGKDAAYNYYMSLPEKEGMTKEDFVEQTGIVPPSAYQKSSITDYLGAYGLPAEQVIQAASLLADTKDEDSELTRDQERYFLFVAGLHVLNLGGIIPSDLRNPATTEAKKQKKMSKQP